MTAKKSIKKKSVSVVPEKQPVASERLAAVENDQLFQSTVMPVSDAHAHVTSAPTPASPARANSTAHDKKWISDLESIDSTLPNEPPFSFIQKLSYATDDNIKIKTLNKDQFLVREGEKGNALFIVVDGIVGIGNEKIVRKVVDKKYWIERTTARKGMILGELEVSLEVPMEKIRSKPYTFEAESATQSAWASSQKLKWLAVYTDDERKHHGEKAKYLEINKTIINRIMKEPELKEYLLFDQFRKARGYILDIEGIVQKGVSDKHKSTDTGGEYAECCRLFREQRKAAKCSINETVYIFGIERLGILFGTSVFKSNKNGHLRGLKDAGRKINLDIDWMCVDCFIKDTLGQTDIPLFQSKAPHATRSDENVLYLERGQKIIYIAPEKSKS